MLPTCAVTCTILDHDGSPVEGATVSAKLNRFEVYEGIVVPHIEVASTDATGICVLNLWPNALGSTASVYDIKIATPYGKVMTTTASVPNTVAEDLHMISALPAYPGKSDGQVALETAYASITVAETAEANALTSANKASTSEANAAAGAVTATTKASEAVASAAAAEIAEAAASKYAGVFSTIAKGMAVTADGEYFAVATVGTEYPTLYVNQAGIAVLAASYALPPITGAEIASNDVLILGDVSTGMNKTLALSEVVNAVPFQQSGTRLFSITPAQITATQNDYSPGDSSLLKVSSDVVGRQITGLTGGADGRMRMLVNTGGFEIALVNESGSSTAANRFTLNGALSMALPPGNAATLLYDGTTARWRVLSRQNELFGQAILDFPSTASSAASDLTIDVPGAVDSDAVVLAVPNAAIVAGAAGFYAWVSAANTVTVRFWNASGAAKDPASGTFRATVVKR